MNKINSRIRAEIEENAELFTSIRRSDIAHHFKGCMVKKGLKVSDVAARLNVSSANVSRMLNGQQNLTLDKMHALADALQERLILALESNWQVADLLDIDVDSRSRGKSAWEIANNYLKINLNDYGCMPIEAANDSSGYRTEWYGASDGVYLEQQA